MGSCCNNRDIKGREIPDGVEPCCNIRGKRCMCLPYDDALVIAAQIMTIIALFISWVWWVTFLISIVGTTFYQLLWCCRQNIHAIYASTAVALISSFVSLGVGIYLLVQWKNYRYCYSFVLDAFVTLDDDSNDYCNEEAWGSIAILCGILWFAVSVCTFYFAKNGRHAKWEELHSKNSAGAAADDDETNEGEEPVAVELGTLPAVSAVAAPILESDEAGKMDIRD